MKREQISSNPCIGSVVPKQDETDSDDDEEAPHYLEKNQLLSLLHAAKDKANNCLNPREAFTWRQMSRVIFVLAYTGMRVGELGALLPKRLDTYDLTIKITSTLYEKRGLKNYYLGPPKTKDSKRTIDISKRVAAVFDAQAKDLKAFKLMCGPKFHTKNDFVFVNYTTHLPGYPLRPASINDLLQVALEAANLPRNIITAHGLRHTFTSLSAEAGVALDDIQKQLGHAKDEMTRRVYLHVTEARRKANVDKLDALMGDIF